jgi:hypothetical protein
MPSPGDLATVTVPTPVITAAYTASPGDFVRTDTTNGSLTVTLPLSPPQNTVVRVKQIAVSGSNTTTVSTSGADVINKVGGGTTLTLTLLSQGTELQYNSGIWLVRGDDLPLGQLDARYLASGSGVTSVTAGDASIVAGGTSTAPTLETGTLDVIASLHAPAAAVGMNSQKITGLAKGANPGEALAYDQIGAPLPSDLNLLWWTFDPAASSASVGVLTTAGTVYLTEFFNRTAQTLSGLLYHVGAQGSVLTSGQCFAGIYDSTGTLRATTSDQSANFGGTGVKSASFTSAYTNAPAGRYYVGFFFNGTTGPSLKGSGAPPSLYNVNLTGANLRCAASSSTGNTTAMPGSITLSGNSGTNALPIWAAGT